MLDYINYFFAFFQFMISLIRDYIDTLSSILHTSSYSFDVIQMTFKFFVQSILGFGQYILTFSWFRDVMSLPIVLPKCQELILSGRFFYEELNIPFFENFVQSSASSMHGSGTIVHVFILGFLNSFFCCLPLSTTHFLAIRRLFVQGVVAGATSTLGMIVGQCLFIFCTVCGLRWSIIPWLSLEPLSYLFGMYLLFTIVYEMSNEKRIRPVDLSEKPILIKIFVLSFLLTWTEEANISQYLTNLTVGANPSVLTIGLGASASIVTNISYVFGILLGQLFFSTLLISLTVVLKNRLFALSQLPYSVWLKRTNTVFLVGILALGISSVPYYSLDYLITSPLGTISEDKMLENSIFSQKNTKDPSRLLTSVDIFFPFAIDTDVSYFDRGDHGDHTTFFKRFYEELNYQGEYAWLIRRDKKPNLYSSGQNTETTIRDLFNLNPSEKNGSGEKPVANASKSSPSEKSQSEFSDSNDGQLKADILAEENFLSTNNSLASDRDLLKVRKRFHENYDETRYSDTYLIGESFHQFPYLELNQTPVEISLKQKFYTNRVYKTLLNLEIDSFLRRQGTSSILTEQQEKDIYKKRIALSRYYDTIRAYQQIPYKDEFQDIFRGSKTFVDRAYNHQFKGTIGVMRRLFAVSLDNTENPNQKSVVKFDQPLPITESNRFAHEEVQKDMIATSTRNNANQWLFNYTNLPVFQTNNEQQSQTNSSQLPFLETNDSTPFYLGWDNETRQMILTKRFNPNSNSISLQTSNKPITNNSSLRSSLKQSQGTESKDLIFTTWPLDTESIMAVKSKPTIEASTLFETTVNPDVFAVYKLTNPVLPSEQKPMVEIFSYPANMRYLTKIPDNLIPNQGGFVWPGSQYKYLVKS